jgi:multidrug efflux system membrane fusion protein
MTRVVITLMALAAVAPACGKKGEAPRKGGGKRAFPVETQPVQARDVEYTVTAVGSVAAFEEVQVTARVAGVVDKVGFVEGQTVAKSAVLVEIDPARYQLAVKAARAALEKAEAAEADAKAGLARREQAVKNNPGLIPGEEVETWRTRVLTAAAELSAARVALEQAQLNLRDAYVRAPLAGMLQTRTVQTGQYVQPGTVLATLVRRDPLLLRFQVPEQDSTRILPGMPARFTVRGGDTEHPLSARISHVTGTADPATRMVAITAEVDDPARATLRPGAFAEVAVPVGGSAASSVIPQISVRPSERGFLAFVVEDGVARERVLTLGLRTADGLVEVKSGVKPGEQIVVRGGEALRDGAQVIVAGGAAARTAPEKRAPGGATPGQAAQP